MRKFFCSVFVFISVFFSPLKADWKVICKNETPVILSICKKNLEKEKAVFFSSFIKAYSGTEVEKMVLKKYDSLEEFLAAAFSEEEEDFKKNKQDTLFISAKTMNGKVIGFIGFDKKEDHAYVRQLAVHSDYQRLGLGTLLTFSFLNFWNDCLPSNW